MKDKNLRTKLGEADLGDLVEIWEGTCNTDLPERNFMVDEIMQYAHSSSTAKKEVTDLLVKSDADGSIEFFDHDIRKVELELLSDIMTFMKEMDAEHNHEGKETKLYKRVRLAAENPIRHEIPKKKLPKPLTQYIAEYLAEEEEKHPQTFPNAGDTPEWRKMIEQAIDAYESTENCKILMAAV